MAVHLNNVFFPSSFQELFSTWSSAALQKEPEYTVLSAGGTTLYSYQGNQTPVIPKNVISLGRIEELKKISRTERYIEIGSMVKLGQIIHFGKIVPEILIRCLEHIADSQLRNLISIGGNLCNSQILDISGPLFALDAQYELRTAQNTRWIQASRTTSHSGHLTLAPQELLTRIRVPLEPWTFSWYRKFNFAGNCEPGGGMLFIIRNEKSILTDIRVLYSGKAILRDKNSESMLSGQHLPLDRKIASAFVDNWKSYLAGLEDKSVFPGEGAGFQPELVKTQILHFIKSTIMHISD
jgi:CO/xanthine dehydrogenase FAD-binding subunit